MNLTERTAEHLEDCIYPVLARQEVFCMELGISKTTYRREMMREGSSWADMYKREICRRISEYESQGITQSSISVLLGYADRAAVSRIKREMRRETENVR